MAYNRTACLFLLIACRVLCFNSVEAVSEQGQTQSERNHQGCLAKCRNMTPSSRDLACTNYELETIPNEIGCQEAVVLDLKKNKIKELRRGDFQGFTELEILLLNDNKITDISLRALKDLVNLEALHMDRNNLTSLRKDVFSGLDHLERLMFTDNQITRITTGVFNTLTALFTLSVDGNMIESIQAGSFDGMAKLAYLHLARNRIASIASGTFTGLAELKVLDLSENRIAILEDGAFRGLHNLETLRLNSNAITVVASIDYLPQLSTLQLADNDIESVVANRFLQEKLESQRFTITAEINPLRCNCSNEALRLWYRNHDDVLDQAMCQAPEEYADTLLVNVEEALRCPTDGLEKDKNELGTSNGTGNDPDTFEAIIGIMVVIGIIILVVAVFTVVRKYRKKTGFDNYENENYRDQPENGNPAANENVANGYHTFLHQDEGGDRTVTRATIEVDTPPPAPSCTGHFFRDAKPADETSDLLHSTDKYLSVDEINPKPLSGRPSEGPQEGHVSPPLTTSTPRQLSIAPLRSVSLDPETVCEIDFSVDGPMVITPGPMFNEDESSGYQDNNNDVQYTQLDHNKSPRVYDKPQNISECYIQPRDLVTMGYVT